MLVLLEFKIHVTDKRIRSNELAQEVRGHSVFAITAARRQDNIVSSIDKVPQIEDRLPAGSVDSIGSWLQTKVDGCSFQQLLQGSEMRDDEPFRFMPGRAFG